MNMTRLVRLLAGRLVFLAVLFTMGCVFASAGSGTAAASSGVQLTAPANNAVASGAINLSCSVPSNVKWINVDVDYGFYASGPAWASSYTTTWNSASVPNGTHTIQCNGYAANGSLVGSPVAYITVSNGAVTLTAPTNNAVVSGTIILSCTVPSSVEWINLDVDYKFYASGSAYSTSYATTWNSASASNGSHSIQCNGYTSNGSLAGNPTAYITVANAIATPTPAPTPTPTPTPAPTPVGCTTIPGTKTPVGIACFPKSSYPALNSPQDPVNYGADKTGVNDSTAAINAALAAGDAYFSTPGTYFVSLTTGNGIIPPSGRTIECVPGVTLIQRAENSCNYNDCGILSLQNGNNTVVGCDFQGGNNASGPLGQGVNFGQYLIMINGNNDTVEGNTFENAWGDAAIQVNSDYTGVAPGNFLIQYNTFTHNPNYSATTDDTSGGIIQNNYVQDSELGPENDGCDNNTHYTRNVVIRNNELIASVGNCNIVPGQPCGGPLYITGGVYPYSCDYSTETVANNYCQGRAGTEAAAIYNSEPGNTQHPASYQNNILGQDCSCLSGSNC